MKTWHWAAIIGGLGLVYWYFLRPSPAGAASTAGNPLQAQVINTGGALMYSQPIGPTPVGYGTVLAPR